MIRLLLGLLAGVGLQAAAPPNFVLILGEGHGWAGTSVLMEDGVASSRSAYVRTPELERLAAGGMRFARCYAASPRCTPSRAALMTGKSPARLHMTFVGEGREGGESTAHRMIPPRPVLGLPAAETTLAELLQRAGYATAHFGKWHLGRAHPRTHGFDEDDGANDNGGPERVEHPHPRQLRAMTGLGLDFITRQARSGRPFYLQLSHYPSRQGDDAGSETLAEVTRAGLAGNARERNEAAAMRDCDRALGDVLRRLEELDLARNTYVLFTTDHGAPGRNPPFAGGKGTVSDGGLRVPLIIRGPGIAPGSCSRVPVYGVDVLPTLIALAGGGGSLPDGLEGGSLVPLLRHGGIGEVARVRSGYVVHFPHYDKDAVGPASAIYSGDFKLIRLYETGVRVLYEVAKDPGERRDLAGEAPGTVAEMDRALTEYLEAVGADLPQPNPQFDAGRTTDPVRKRGGKPRGEKP